MKTETISDHEFRQSMATLMPIIEGASRQMLVEALLSMSATVHLLFDRQKYGRDLILDATALAAVQIKHMQQPGSLEHKINTAVAPTPTAIN